MIGRQRFVTREDNRWHRIRLVVRWLLINVLISVRTNQELSIVGASHLQMKRMLSDSGCHSHIAPFSHAHALFFFTLADTYPPPFYPFSLSLSLSKSFGPTKRNTPIRL